MTSSLGDHFPTELREEFIERNLARGNILRTHTALTTPPKVKLFVIWGVDKVMGTVGISFINTEMIPSQDLRLQRLQLFLRAEEDRKYLDHDSYLDCTRIYEEDVERIKQLIFKPSVVIGKMCVEDISAAEDLIRLSPMIEKKLRRKYGFLVGQ